MEEELGVVLPRAWLDLDDKTRTYKLTVAALPETSQTVYLKCGYTKASEFRDDPNRIVKVAVSAAAAEGGPTSTGKPMATPSASVTAALPGIIVSAVLASTGGIN